MLECSSNFLRHLKDNVESAGDPAQGVQLTTASSGQFHSHQTKIVDSRMV